jgi:hypothetical protein
VSANPALGLAPLSVTAEGGALWLRVVVCSASAFLHGGGGISCSFLGGAGRIRTDVSGQEPLCKGGGFNHFPTAPSHVKPAAFCVTSIGLLAFRLHVLIIAQPQYRLSIHKIQYVSNSG